MQAVTEQIWNEFAPRLQHFILARVSNKQDAEDILHQVFARIHASIDSLREDSKLKAWIYRITRNAIVDFYRGRREFTELPDLADGDEEQEDNMTKDILPFVKFLVQRLDEKYREPLMLTEYAGLSHRAAAKKLGISLSALKVRVHRGRQQIKKMMLDCCHFDFDRYGNVIECAPKCDRC